MESIFKWQTGKPNKFGKYVITLKWKTVESDWYDKDLGWYRYHDKDIIAWCLLSDIEPYKD